MPNVAAAHKKHPQKRRPVRGGSIAKKAAARFTRLIDKMDSARAKSPSESRPKPYDVRVDAKHRLTIRGTAQKFFRVEQQENGTIILKPRELRDVEPVSARTLRAMDEAMKNLRAGKRSQPADLKKYARFAK